MWEGGSSPLPYTFPTIRHQIEAHWWRGHKTLSRIAIDRRSSNIELFLEDIFWKGSSIPVSDSLSLLPHDFVL